MSKAFVLDTSTVIHWLLPWASDVAFPTRPSPTDWAVSAMPWPWLALAVESL
jgi:hypothetical protein